MTVGAEPAERVGGRRFRFPWSTLVLWVSAVVVAFPFAWMLRSAIMPTKYIMKFPPIWIPPQVTWDNFTKLLTLQPFGLYIGNSLLVAVIVTIGQVAISALSGYAFARLRFPGRDRLFVLYLATMIIPSQVTLIPQYALVSRLGWVDSYAALTVPFLSSTFLTFLLRQFFLSIPGELEDAAKIDGAGYLRTFATIIMPLAAPALATSALLAFIGNWTSYLWPLIVTRSREMRTIPLGLASFQDETAGHTDFGQMMAGSVLSMLPMFILFVLLQRYIVQSLATTGLKG
ncbi:MAG: carbohydrate ABC transporter permease [Devosia sp.]|jgi:multiple sugar transport system permease protein